MKKDKKDAATDAQELNLKTKKDKERRCSLDDRLRERTGWQCLSDRNVNTRHVEENEDDDEGQDQDTTDIREQHPKTNEGK